jgi:hypothetical protein
MNHSPRFWATVQSVFPDFEIARHQLRQHASADLPDFEKWGSILNIPLISINTKTF